MKDVIISPPFGTWLNLAWTTSVIGTFTYEKRPGRFLQGIRTIRPTKGGWVNKVGLKNSGLQNPDMVFKIKKFKELDTIISIHGFDYTEWLLLHHWFLNNELNDITLEMNISCPNVITTDFNTRAFGLFTNDFKNIIVKLPPNNIELFRSAYDSGIRIFHCCNTLPTYRGGESGSILKPLSLEMIRQIRKEVDDVTIIGGGGIYTPEDVIDYHNAGADKFSLSTIFFTPWKISAVKQQIGIYKNI